MIRYRSASGKLLPFPPRNLPHDPREEHCGCDDCQLIEYEQWADKIDNESRTTKTGFIVAILVVAIIVFIWATI